MKKRGLLKVRMKMILAEAKALALLIKVKNLSVKFKSGR
jgi:hypothetical protein